MTTKKLNARQARWAELLANFHFLIRYRPGKDNTLVDALSQPDQSDKEGITQHRTQALLKPDYLEKGVALEPLILAPIDPSLEIIDRVLCANTTSETLEEYHEQAYNDNEEIWTLEEDKLLYKRRLVVSKNGDLQA
jgi:hypothetical protein